MFCYVNFFKKSVLLPFATERFMKKFYFLKNNYLFYVNEKYTE